MTFEYFILAPQVTYFRLSEQDIFVSSLCISDLFGILYDFTSIISFLIFFYFKEIGKGVFIGHFKYTNI